MNQENRITKSLEDLNLLDRFLFAEAMEDEVICKNMLELIFGRSIELEQVPHTEKEFRTTPDKRSIRVDVYAMDAEQNVYDTEVQKINTRNLPKRSRFYQALVDSSLLEPGIQDFNELNGVYIILITPFDLFGRGRYQYTFQMKCLEETDLELGDGSVRIFLNTHGCNREGVRQELIDFLDYVEKGAQEGLPQNSDPRLQEIDSRVHNIKSRKEVGVRYMHFWLENEIELREAKKKMREELRMEVEEEVKEELRKKEREAVHKEIREEVYRETREEIKKEVLSEGISIGRERGQLESMRTIVKNMLAKGLPEKMILELTGCEKCFLEKVKADCE